jgi:hypothetical protein
MGSRHVAVVAAFAAGVIGVGGVAVAANKSTHVQACANSKGVLALLSANGSCPTGFSKVAIAERGVRGPAGVHGKRGATGPRGARGKPGNPGVGPQSTIATVSVSRGKVIALAGTNVTVKAACTPAKLAKLVFSGPGNYLVHGVSDFVTSVSSDLDAMAASHPGGLARTDVIDTGSGLIDFETDTKSTATLSTISMSGLTGTGDLSTNLLVGIDDKTYTIDLFLTVGPGTCEAAAQVMPAV